MGVYNAKSSREIVHRLDDPGGGMADELVRSPGLLLMSWTWRPQSEARNEAGWLGKMKRLSKPLHR